MQVSMEKHKNGKMSLQPKLTISEYAKGVIYYVNWLEYLIDK